jgi:hypothetical protein
MRAVRSKPQPKTWGTSSFGRLESVNGETEIRKSILASHHLRCSGDAALHQRPIFFLGSQTMTSTAPRAKNLAGMRVLLLPA